MAQKRNFDRLPASGSATIRVGHENQEAVKAEIEEFSSKGISVKSPRAFEIGATVSFELLFSFLADVPICETGQIKHVTEMKESHRTYFKIGIESAGFGRESFMTVMNSYLDHKRKMSQKKPSIGGRGLPF